MSEETIQGVRNEDVATFCPECGEHQDVADVEYYVRQSARCYLHMESWDGFDDPEDLTDMRADIVIAEARCTHCDSVLVEE